MQPDSKAVKPSAVAVLSFFEGVAERVATMTHQNLSAPECIERLYPLADAIEQDVSLPYGDLTQDNANEAGRLIKRLSTDQVVPEGINVQTWDLRSQGGSRVPGGLYLVSIEAKAENGQRVRSIVPATVMLR